MKRIITIMMSTLLLAAMAFSAVAADDTTANDATAVAKEAASPASNIPTFSDLVIDKLASAQGSVVVTYKVNVGIPADCMQALKAAEGKAIVLKERQGKDASWQIVIRSENITADPARSFTSKINISQNVKDASITLEVGEAGKSLGCNAMFRIPIDNGKLQNGVKLDPEKLSLYKLNVELNKWEKTTKAVKVNESDNIYFFADAGGKYMVINDYSK